MTQEIIDRYLNNHKEVIYLSTKEYAAKHNTNPVTIRSQIRRGKFKDRLKKCSCGQAWLIKDYL